MASCADLKASLTVRQLPASEAREYLTTATTASWRQFPAYSSVAASCSGSESCYFLVSDSSTAIAVANVRIKRLPIVQAGIAMIAQGPVMLKGEPALRDVVIQTLSDHVVGTLGLTLRINPAVEINSREHKFPVPFRPLPSSEYETFLIDLAPSIDDLRKRLNGKWRTDLRRGEKAEVVITRSSCTKDFAAFQPLLDDLSKSKGFAVPQDALFFAKVADEAESEEKIEVHLAYHQGRVIGGHVGAFTGDMAVYLIGAVNDEGRDLRASFLLQWSVIQYAKSLGMRWYDLGGANEADNPHVYRFKKRMGGIHYVGAPVLESEAAWPCGQIVRLAEQLYTRVKG